jgi:FdhD protein
MRGLRRGAELRRKILSQETERPRWPASPLALPNPPHPDRIANMPLPDQQTTAVQMTRVRGEEQEQRHDLVAVEEPLEIRIAWRAEDGPREKNISVTMRTPGDDYDLAAGFLFTEGLLRSPEEIESIRHWGSPNVIRVALAPGSKPDTAKLDRHFYTTSSCGVCGKTSIEALRTLAAPLPHSEPIAAQVIRTLPAVLEQAQTAFQATGSLHGAALVDRAGTLLTAREDVGRHNAADKVIGSLFRTNALPAPGTILILSSRASFEIIQKAVMAGIPTVTTVGGPTSLAIELARDVGITLIGFLRDARFNVYTGTVAEIEGAKS